MHANRHSILLPLLLAALMPGACLAQAPDAHGATISANVKRAVDDPARSADKVDDARRKVAQVMAFAEVKPGQKVLELMPGKGYFTRVFSTIVGPEGRVYTVWPQEAEKYSAEAFANISAQAAGPHYANIRLL
ncbi:MAG: methyltransferase, partial [Rhodanobacter sp.]